jgi:hypothetical protein
MISEKIDLKNYYDKYNELYECILININNLNVINENIILRLNIELFDLLNDIFIYLDNDLKKIIIYDVHLIVNIMSMITNKQFTSCIKIKNSDKIINLNRIKKIDDKVFYYLEECYIDDINLFYDELKNLNEMKKSKFLYKSNIVNVTLLLKYLHNIEIQEVKDIELNTIKINLIKSILNTYSECNYDNVKRVYLEYLEYLNFNKLILNENYYRIKQLIELSGENYFIYLSCNLLSEKRLQRFEFTNIVISHLEFKDFTENITKLYNRMTNLSQINKQYDIEELTKLQQLIKNLYEYYGDTVILHKILEKIYNNYYGFHNKMTFDKLIEQITEYYTINMNTMYQIIKYYCDEYLLINPDFVFDVKKCEQLNELEKQKMIYDLKIFIPDKYYDELIKFITNYNYTINLYEPLSYSQINILKKIMQISKTYDIHTINHSMIQFLRTHYDDLFKNNKDYDILLVNLNKLL